MSKQGNVKVLYGGGYCILTSGRWSGGSVPTYVQEALRGLERPLCHLSSKEFMGSLIQNEACVCSFHPVTVIGNCDTPTVIVDFDHKTVTIDEQDQNRQSTFSFEEFCKLEITGCWFEDYSFA